MRIYRVIVDKKPEWCIHCPVRDSLSIDCGAMKSSYDDDWYSAGLAPDGRCLLVEKDGVIDEN